MKENKRTMKACNLYANNFQCISLIYFLVPTATCTLLRLQHLLLFLLSLIRTDLRHAPPALLTSANAK